MSQSGLFDVFVRGVWGQEKGETVRSDKLVYTGSIEKLLECRTSSGRSVFDVERFEDEIVLKTTAYATCVRPRKFDDITKGVYAIETAFPIAVRVQRSLTGLSVRAPTVDNVLSRVHYKLAFARPVVLGAVGAGLAGSEFTSFVLDFYAFTKNESTSNMPVYHRMLNVSSAVAMVASFQSSLIKFYDLAEQTEGGECILEDNQCKQLLHLSMVLDTRGSLAKSFGSDREADKEISQSFDVFYASVQCPDDFITPSCESLSQDGKVSINVVMTLSFIVATSHDDPQVTMTVYGLRRTRDMDDVVRALVPQGEQLVLMSRIGPGEIRDEYNATLTDLTICRGIQQDGCESSPDSDKFTYYNNSRALIDGVFVMSRNEYKIYEVYFPMRGLLDTDVDETITAKYVIENENTGQVTHIDVIQRVSFHGCPTNSVYNSVAKLCVCRVGFLLTDDTKACYPDPHYTPDVTESHTTTSTPTLRVITKPSRSGTSSLIVYLTLTLVMMTVAIYI